MYARTVADMTEELLSRWDPLEIDRKVRESQKRRSYLVDYLFSYIDDERTSIDPRFAGDLNA